MEVINSFFSNIKDKLTNPFFGTLIIVLLIHHWELIYSIFNFGDTLNLNQKLSHINTYVSSNITFKSLAWDVLYALAGMLIGYLVVVCTRSLVLWVEFRLMPAIMGKIVNKNVVRKSEYDEVVLEREKYFDQYEEQRKNVRIFSETIDEQTEIIKSNNSTLIEQSENISTSVAKIEKLEKDLSSINENKDSVDKELASLNEITKILQEKNSTLLFNLRTVEDFFITRKNEDFYSKADNFPQEIRDIVDQLKNENKSELFLDFGNFYEHGGSFNSKKYKELVTKGLAIKREPGSGMVFTSVGKIIWRNRKTFFGNPLPF